MSRGILTDPLSGRSACDPFPSMSELSHHHATHPTLVFLRSARRRVEHATSGSADATCWSASAAGALAAAGWPGAADAAPGRHRRPSRSWARPTCTRTSSTGTTTRTRPSDSAGNAVGLARVASLVNQIRADRGREHTLLFDAGDTIQGTPLGFYYATSRARHREPARPTDGRADERPGLRRRRPRQPRVQLRPRVPRQLDLADGRPVLAANAVHAGTKVPRYTPYTITTMKVRRPPIRVGVLGLTIRRRHLGQGERVGQGRGAGPRRGRRPLGARDAAEGADIIVVSAHSGEAEPRRTRATCPIENARGSSPSRCPASTRSSSGTRTSMCPAPRQEPRDRRARSS